MFKVNQKMIKCIMAGVVLGMPLIFSFVLEWMGQYRMVSIVLLVVSFCLNNRYPDRLVLEEGQLKVKLFLVNEWMVYPMDQVKFSQEKGYIALQVSAKKVYHISMDGLSMRLYGQLKPYMMDGKQ